LPPTVHEATNDHLKSIVYPLQLVQDAIEIWAVRAISLGLLQRQLQRSLCRSLVVGDLESRWPSYPRHPRVALVAKQPDMRSVFLLSKIDRAAFASVRLLTIFVAIGI
jgi:hypothetical protein